MIDEFAAHRKILPKSQRRIRLGFPTLVDFLGFCQTSLQETNVLGSVDERSLDLFPPPVKISQRDLWYLVERTSGHRCCERR